MELIFILYYATVNYHEFIIILSSALVIFSILAKISPCNEGQPLIRHDMLTDLLYRLVVPFTSRFVTLAMLTIGVGIIFHGTPPEQVFEDMQDGYGYPGSLPLWAQAAAVFIISDFLLYWLHRFFHTPTMWKWHAIHHSSKVVDWLSTHRFHPVNVWLSFTLVDALMILSGFSPQSIAIMGLFNIFYSYMVHANLNWTFGKFRYIFASPVFHRWHHSCDIEAQNKNFAPTFPLLDLMFGTFYMPEGKLPNNYGAQGMDIPESFIGQLIFPFKK